LICANPPDQHTSRIIIKKNYKKEKDCKKFNIKIEFCSEKCFR
jgi:hypothetical protein